MSTGQKKMKVIKPKVEVETKTPVVDVPHSAQVKTEVTPKEVHKETANENVEVTKEVVKETPTPTPTKSRTQTSKAIGVDISPARVRRHLDKINLNKKIDSMVAELKATISEYEEAKQRLDSGKKKVFVEKEVDGKKLLAEELKDLTHDEQKHARATVEKLGPSIDQVRMKAGALSRERTRFSNDASIALAIICDELIQELATHTMNKVIDAKKKIIQISHLHEEGIEKLSLFPLIRNLPLFMSTAKQLDDSLKKETQEKLLSTTLQQAEKDWKKKYDVHTKKKKAAEPVQVAVQTAVAVEQPEEEEEDDTSDSKTSFRFYVHLVCKNIIRHSPKNESGSPKYGAVRVSTEIRAYLSDLLVQLIQRLSHLVLLTATSMKIKTVNDTAILQTVEALLVDGHDVVETVEYVDAMVPDQAVVKAEVAKREEVKKKNEVSYENSDDTFEKNTPEYKEKYPEYKIDLKNIPTVKGVVAEKTMSYPTSGYAALAKKVEAKLKLYESLSPASEPVEVAAV